MKNIAIFILLFCSVAFSRDRQAQITIIKLESVSLSGRLITWSPDGKHIAVAPWNAGKLELWEVENLETETPEIQFIAFVESEETIFRQITWSPSGDKIAGVDSEKLYIWDAFSHNLLFEKNISEYQFFEWSPDGKYIAIYGQSVGLLNFATRQVEYVEIPSEYIPSIRIWSFHKVAWGAKNNLAIIISDYKIIILGLEDEDQVVNDTCFSIEGYEAEWDHQGDWLASNDEMCQPETGERISIDTFFAYVSWSPDNTHLAGISLDAIAIIDASDGNVLHNEDFNAASFTSIEWHPTANILATVNLDAEVQFWRIDFN